MAKDRLFTEAKFERLTSSVEWSDRQLVTPRENRISAIRQFVGFNYSDNGAEKKVPTPYLKLAVSIYVRMLAPVAPRVMFSTDRQDLMWMAEDFAIAVNQVPAEIRLQKTLSRIVLEALFSIGVAKVGQTKIGAMLGESVGETFVDAITLDDLILDMSANHMSRLQYIGNKYWLDYEELQESDWFPKKNKNDLQHDEFTVIGEKGESRAEGIAKSETAQLFKEKILLHDIWLPSEKVMVTYAAKSKKILKTFKWTGPSRGPYPILGFDEVPGNLLPLSPVSTWIDLHELANTLFRKLGRQADAQKTVQGFQGGNDDDVKAFGAATDGDGILYRGGEPKPLKAGGVDPTTLLFYMQCKDLISYFASNLDSLGGLSPQAETLGQDKLLSEASGAQLRDMAGKVIDFSSEIFDSISFYEWNDVVRTRTLDKEVPGGSGLSIKKEWNQASRIGAYEDFNLEIDIYSLQDKSPSIQLQKLRAILDGFVFPLMPAITQAGGTLEVQKILNAVAKYSDFQELKGFVQFVTPVQSPGGGKEGGMPANTTRTNVRVNRPGATNKAKSDLMQRVLAGGTPQGSEMGSLDRSAG